MAKYIERDAFIAWLKKIPMVDLSDGRGLCRVIFEDDFKRAIKNMPENIIHESEVKVVRCKDCKHTKTDGCEDPAIYCKKWDRWEMPEDFFCKFGERK